jgi:HSP20 family protein
MNAVAENETQTQTATPPPANAERYVAPRVQLSETKDGYVLQAEVPGVNKEGLTIDLKGNILTFEGRRQVQTVTGTLTYRETRPATFRRVFELDPVIDTERISARIEQGVLTLQLPKADKAKPRKIDVN